MSGVTGWNQPVFGDSGGERRALEANGWNQATFIHRRGCRRALAIGPGHHGFRPAPSFRNARPGPTPASIGLLCSEFFQRRDAIVVGWFQLDGFLIVLYGELVIVVRHISFAETVVDVP